jgi:hypothetical protein
VSAAPRFYVLLPKGKHCYLVKFDAGWLEVGDDPFSWTSDPAHAGTFTEADVEAMRPGLSMWHGEVTTQEVR